MVPTEPKAPWERLVDEMLAAGDATYGSAATDGKIFAMLVHGRLVVKLPAKRVEALVEDGTGHRFDPGHGRIQREWLDVGADSYETWLALAMESEAFVGGRAPKG